MSLTGIWNISISTPIGTQSVVLLNMALLAARKIGIDHIEIFVPCGWTDDVPWRDPNLEEDGPLDLAKTKT